MRDKLDNILNNSECISEEMLLNYLEGTLIPSDQHHVEKHLLDCEFCSEALEGLSAMGFPNVRTDLNKLDQRINYRVNRSGGKIIQLKRVYRIAAVIALVALFGGGFYYLQSMKKSEKVFTENFEPYRDTSHFVSPGATVPQEEQKIMNNHEKISTGSFKNEKKFSKKGNAEKTPFDDSTVQTITTSKTGQGAVSSQPSTADETKRKDVSTTAPAAGYDKSVAINEIKATKKTVSDESKDVEVLSKNADDTKQLREEQYALAQSAAAKEKKSEAQMPASATFESAVVVDSLRSGQIVLIKAGIKQYEEKNYSAAVTVLQQVLKKEPGNTEALFYCGVSQLSRNQDAVAINLLESVVKNSPNKFLDAAKWYLSLAYLKKNKTSKAKKLLEDLSHGNSEYKPNAQKTLDELK